MSVRDGRLFFVVVMAGGLALTYLFHAYAFNAPWFYDDAPTLRSLSDVHDWDSSWAFIWSGVASTIGRPLANASYLLNVADWPGNPAGFRHTGALLHLLNALLLAWVALRVARQVPALRERAEVFAALLAVVWAAHPLMFSANLMPVQRMTVLAATFTLLGLLLYVIGRQRMASSETWRSGLLLCSVGVGGGAVLGVLVKENAALLPFLVAVLEFAVLRRMGNSVPGGLWKAWLGLFFAVPLLLLLAYVAHAWPTLLVVYDARPFSFGERLASQTVLLWQYIRQIFLPNVMSLGPFQDGVRVYALLAPQALIAGLAWIVLLTAAWLERRRSGLLLFAVGWFLVGHLLESTVFPLEMSFEHRNYVPAIGPIAVLIAGGLMMKPLRLLPWAFMCIVLLVGWRASSLWSDTLTAAEMQQAYHPRSARAAQFVAMLYDRLGDDATTYRVIELAVERMPEASDLLASKLMLGCRANDQEVIDESLRQFDQRATRLDPSFALTDTLRHIKDLVKEGSCELPVDDLMRVTGQLLENPRIRANGLLTHNIYHFRADLLHDSASPERALDELFKAFEVSANPETIILIASMLDTMGMSSDALYFFDRAVADLPLSALRRQDGWRDEAAKMRAHLCSRADSC